MRRGLCVLVVPFVLVACGDGGEQGGAGSASTVAGDDPTDRVRVGPSLYPVSLSVVRPGEAVPIVLRDATKVRGEAHAFALGCEEAVSQFTLDATVTSWTIDLEPGAYKLELFAEFEAPGKGGDTSSTLGLQVDAAAEPAIMPAPNPVPACSAGQSR